MTVDSTDGTEVWCPLVDCRAAPGERCVNPERVPPHYMKRVRDRSHEARFKRAAFDSAAGGA